MTIVAVDRTHTVAAGGTVYAGASPVATGIRFNLNLNSASQVDYDFEFNGRETGPFDNWWNGYGQYRSFPQMVSAWSGGIYAPDYGTAGGVVCFGGGHGANVGMFAYVFNLATKQWVQVGAPRNLPANAAWSGRDVGEPNDYNAATDLRDLDWYDYDYNGSRILLIDHTYNTVTYVSTAEGGGANGSLLIATAAQTQDPSQGSKYSPHLFSLTDGTMTRALSTAPNIAAVTDKNFAVKDTDRSRVWYFRQGGTLAYYVDFSGGFPGTWGSHTLLDEAAATYTIFPEKRSMEYCTDADCMVLFTVPETLTLNATVAFVVFSMSTGVPVKLNLAGLPTTTALHGGQWISAAWSPSQQAFYLYEGMGDEFCLVLRPSSLNFATCTWAWTKESFTGPTPPARNTPAGVASSDAWGAFRRFVWDAGTGCFVWHDGPLQTGLVDGVSRNGIVQLWRPPGVVME